MLWPVAAGSMRTSAETCDGLVAASAIAGKHAPECAMIDTILLTSGNAQGERAACSEQLRAQEDRVFSVIGDEFRIELSGDRLTLISRSGETLVYRARR